MQAFNRQCTSWTAEFGGCVCACGPLLHYWNQAVCVTFQAILLRNIEREAANHCQDVCAFQLGIFFGAVFCSHLSPFSRGYEGKRDVGATVPPPGVNQAPQLQLDPENQKQQVVMTWCYQPLLPDVTSYSGLYVTTDHAYHLTLW